MSIEIKTLDVANEAENQTIRVYQYFGWKFKSSQRIYNKNTSLEKREGDLYAVTETMDYTKLVFERDTNMKNYQRLRELELKYHGLYQSLPNNPPLYSSDVSMDEWGRSARPDVTGFLGGTVSFILAAGAALSAMCIAATMLDPTPLIEQIKKDFVAFGGFLAISAVAGWIVSALLKKIIFRPVTLGKALKGYPCKERERLAEQYKIVHNKAVEYETKLAKIEEIFEEAASLCE